jgi:hypothetical protein
MSADCPLARSEGLIVKELDGELLVYDSETNLAHALSVETATLWRACDGCADTRALSARCHTSVDVVQITVARLRELGLLEGEDAQDGDTRRDALRKITIAGAGLAAVPTISSIVVPTAAQAASVPTSKDQCKNGGWRNFPQFKNQGDCVSFVETGK